MGPLKTIDDLDASAEKIGVIGSPSATSNLKMDIMGYAVDKKLVGALTYFKLVQDAKENYALGQITEIQLRNPWVEDSTMRSLIRQKGRVDPVTERQDTHNADMEVGAVFQKTSEGFVQSEFGTIPPTGTDIKMVDNNILDILLCTQIDNLVWIGNIYGTSTLFPAWIKHFGDGEGGAGEAYHFGIFGKTGSGKSFLARIFIIGYVRHPEMSIIIIDPQGEFAKEFREGTESNRFVRDYLKKEIEIYSSNNIVLTDSRDYIMFKKLLVESPFFLNLGVKFPENREVAANQIMKGITGKRKKKGLYQFQGNEQTSDQATLKPWHLYKQEWFDRCWSELSRDEIINMIYTSTDGRARVRTQYETADKDEFYRLWRGIAKLFSWDDRPGAKKLTDIIEEISTPKSEGKMIIIDLSEETAPSDMIWDENIQLVVLNKLFSDIQRRGTESYKQDVKLNTLILLDEAHRFGSSERSENENLENVKRTLVDAVRTTRKYGLGWGFISQTLSSLNKEITQQMRIYVFGYGLAWGTELNALKEIIGGSKALKLYQSFRDPESSLGEKQYPFMAVGPLTPLSFSGYPLFFTALKYPEDVILTPMKGLAQK